MRQRGEGKKRDKEARQRERQGKEARQKHMRDQKIAKTDVKQRIKAEAETR